MKLTIVLMLISFSLQAQILDLSLPAGIIVKGNTYTFGPLSETDLNLKPVVPRIIKNRQLHKEYLCMKFFNNQIRRRDQIINLSKKGNFLYAKYNWIHKDKKEVINKRLYFDPKSKCHYIGNFKNHELYKVDGKSIDSFEAKDIQIVAYTGEDGGLSLNMGRDPSLVKGCEIREPIQDADYYKYNQFPSIKDGMVNCQARFKCHKATTDLKFDAVKEGRPVPFEFNGYCVTVKNGKYTCAKVHPDQCADAYVSAIVNQELAEKNKKERRPRRFKNKKSKGTKGIGASR